jgi:hypothetical protein
LPSPACPCSCSTAQKLRCGIGFLPTFRGGAEVGFFHSVFLIPTTILGIVHGICNPMFLAQVAMFLGASFLGNLAHRLGMRSLVTFLAFVRSFCVGLYVGFFLDTCRLNSVERHKKQTHVNGCHTFLVKGELFLPRVWGHSKNMTC